MQIIIEDKRYPVKTTLRKATEDDINKINDTAEIVKRSSQIDMHAKISERVMSLTEMVNDPSINDDPVDLTQFEKLANTENIPIVNMHIETTRTDLSSEELKQIVDFAQKTLNESDGVNDGVKKDDILEIDETIKIEGINEGLNEGISEGVSEGVNIHPEADFHEKQTKKDNLLEWSGETFTVNVNEKEVKLEDISPQKEKIPVETLSKNQREEIEKNELLIDPDAPPIEQVDMIKKLKHFEMHQPDIVKK